MTEVRVEPSVVRGRVRAPGSKSYTHRALIAAALAEGACVLRRPLVADDTLRTVRALRTLGARIRLGRHAWTVRPIVPVRGKTRTVRCGESGTTLRLVAALAALQHRSFRLVGQGELPRRPMAPLVSALVQLGADVSSTGKGSLPLLLRGPIRAGRVLLDSTESSQFTSALLFALPTLAGSSRISLRGRPVSEPYVRATVAVLADRGVRIRKVPHGFAVAGPQRFAARDWEVPGDASSSAYLWAAAALTGGRVTVDGVPSSWPQADLLVLDLLRDYGARVERRGDAVTVTGGGRRPFRVDLDSAPDLLPLAGVLAAAAPGRSVLRGAAHAAVKESDRRVATARLVRAIGGRVRVSARRLEVHGVREPRAIRLLGSRDHRVVMSAVVAGLAGSGTGRVSDGAAASKSFPGFVRALRALGGSVSER